jgi:hypothetical protein
MRKFFLALSILSAISKLGDCMCAPPDTRCYTHQSNKLFFGDKEVIGADASTFEILNPVNPLPVSPCPAECPISAKDKNAVYVMGIRFTEPDPKTFRYLGSIFFSDDKHVYFTALALRSQATPAVSHLHVLQELDPKTFHEEGSYWQDDKTIVVDIVHHVNIRKADFLNYGAGYVGDGKHIYTTGCYTSGLLVMQADPKSFKGLDSSYATDHQNAYWCGLKVSGNPDLATFHLDDHHNACDKLGCFEYGNRKT